MKTIIIGGVAGGATAAARLRRLDESAEIVLLERGEYISFANCGLPYYIGGAIAERDALTLQTPQSFSRRYRVDVRNLSEATAIDPARKTVTVLDLRTGNSYEEAYDDLILSPGAAPIVPAVPGSDLAHVFTLRTIPDTDRIKHYVETAKPRSAVIVGGGYIGAELAENLHHAGLNVSVVERSDHLIAPLDFDMAADVHQYLRTKGIRLYLQSSVAAIEETRVLLEDGGVLAADLVVLAVGVRPESALAQKAGLSVNDRGSILVDRRMRTSAPHVYAVGDAVEVRNFLTQAPAFLPLAGPANKQGRIAADNIAGIPSEYEGTQGSAVLKLFEMTVATTGLNEAAAKAAGIDYDKTYTYSASHASYYPGGRPMSVKVLWEKKTMRLLGAQIVGFDGVDKRMDVIATAIRFGAKATELAGLELCYAPPYGSAKDPVNMVGFVAENVANGTLRQFFWHDVAKLPRDGSVTLLDTRTEAEFAAGHIDGFVNIPLDSLRARLGEIPAEKPVFVHCHSGFRSYLAHRILVGAGLESASLAGGWRLYESVIHEREVPHHPCTFRET